MKLLLRLRLKSQILLQLENLSMFLKVVYLSLATRSLNVRLLTV
jgi:hypothetical protein